MKKVFRMKDLDCANCAAKMEEAIRKIKGVNSADISFMTQKLKLDVDSDKFDDSIKEIIAVCKKIEPDCQIIL